MYEKNNRTIQRCLHSVCPKWQPIELRKLVIFEWPLFWTVLKLYQSFTSIRPLQLFITKRGFRLQTLTCPNQLIFLGKRGGGWRDISDRFSKTPFYCIIHRSQKYMHVFLQNCTEVVLHFPIFMYTVYCILSCTNVYKH